MRTRTGWLALLLTAGLTLAPSVGWGQEHHIAGQDVPPADEPILPLPLWHSHPEQGGFFAAAEFLFWRQTNPIKNQSIAVRGFVDTDGSVQNAVNLLNGPNPLNPGGFPFASPTPGYQFGSHLEALNANEVSGPNGYTPGLAFTVGWLFGNGVALEFTWRHLFDVKNTASAGAIPPNQWPGYNTSDTVMFSPVFNFPVEYAGPSQKIAVSGPNAASNGFVVTGAAYGIWNGASEEWLSFVQRHDEFELMARFPAYENDYARVYGLAGLRHVQMWERFQWAAQSNTEALQSVPVIAGDNVVLSQQLLNFQVPVVVNFTQASGINLITQGGRSGLEDEAIYSNIVSQRMYGPMVGCGTECYLGCGVSCSIDARAGLLLNFVKEEAKYERGDRFISQHQTRREFTIVPETDLFFNMNWKPFEGVEIRVGYDLMAYFNTIASETPVSFNYGTLDPPYTKGVFRLFDGWTAGIALVF